MLIYALTLAQSLPIPLTATHQRDIGCVAALAIIADEQKRGVAGNNAYPDVRETGKRWAGIVGERIMDETGQPKEVVAFAMTEAAKAEQGRVEGAKDPAAIVFARVNECNALMMADLAVADASEVAPENNDTDEPAVIERRKAKLREDMDSPQRIRFCAGMIKSTYSEIAGREGANSRDATTFARLAQAFDARLTNLPAGAQPTEVAPQPDKEEQMARCIRLGESLALALPPE